MFFFRQKPRRHRFNTQPPEGGWMFIRSLILRSAGFNTQPPEGGWGQAFTKAFQSVVSTHSRLKAAGGSKITLKLGYQVSTHSRLKAAGNAYRDKNSLALRFNTQPPEGGWVILLSHRLNQSCFNTQPPEGGWLMRKLEFIQIP